ncbi:MAG: hypothetical protein AUI08_06505 [Gemmatimonadetes bacterium 13_2_20CM_2_65_7]|nr:MAG: hypothetical protein AUI08_06505 [Gemmatimonadetes bacterium 13_2_20CM_2_65_7]
MRNRLLPALPALLLTLTARPVAAQTSPQLRWELVGDSIAVFTLTNRGTKPLPPSGWAIYYNALHGARPGSVGAGFTIEDLPGDLHRLVPAAGFAGLARGASVRIPYVTDLLLNRSFVPQGPYIVFDDAKDVGVPLSDYVAAPFEHPSVASPEKQFALDSAIRDLAAGDLPPVFPTPVQLTKGAGALRFTAMPPVEAPEALKTEAAFAAEYLRPYFGTTQKRSGPPLRLEVGSVEGQTSPEAYSLVVDTVQGVRVVGTSRAGVFYGLQSLRSLLPTPTPRTGLVLSAIRVVDAPRFGYRGFMLDVARNFHSKPLVLRTLDLLARYKLNVFHMHLTDDEGWRVEIPSLPELTAVGARRGHPPDSDRHLQPAFGSGPAVDRPWGSGFFSHADYVEIVRYAAARHIEVIPEIEMPGHARAAVKAMQRNQQYRLNDPDDRSVYTSVQGYPDNVMNPALESTYGFIERVVSDLAAMHREAGAPLRHIHMGGDEVPAGVWVGSPAVQAYMQAHGLTSVDDLWFVFYGRVEQILKAQGIAPSGWEEIAVRKTSRDGRRTNIPNPDFAARGWRAYVWNNVPGGGAEDLAYRLANGGYDVDPPRPPRQSFGPRRVRRQGPAHRLRPRTHRGDSSGSVVGDAGRGGSGRVHARPEIVRPRRAGVGARPRLGERARRREIRLPLSRGLVPLREYRRPARAASTRSGGPGPQLSNPHTGLEGRRGSCSHQHGAAGLHSALHDGRQRAYGPQRRSARSDPLPRDSPRRRIQLRRPKGPHGQTHRSLTMARAGAPSCPRTLIGSTMRS